jgi:2-polyprenyl-3-methyl-5-hydroxy-6-metoxy-1,4-benzoquinol methylase
MYNGAMPDVAEFHARCRVCDGENKPDRLLGWRLERCASCGYVQVLNAEGRGEYWVDGESADASAYWVGAKKRYFIGALELLEASVPGRRLLDIGGGVGFFSQLAIERTWDAYSLDLSPAATRLAAERLGAARAWRTFPHEQAGSFDAVTLWCVVAHTRQPRELIGLAANALKPGGIVWLTTPNFRFQRPVARLRSLLGQPMDFGREDHLGQFEQRSLEALTSGGGFGGARVHFADHRNLHRRGFASRRIGVRQARLQSVGAARSARRTHEPDVGAADDSSPAVVTVPGARAPTSADAVPASALSARVEHIGISNLRVVPIVRRGLN